MRFAPCTADEPCAAEAVAVIDERPDRPLLIGGFLKECKGTLFRTSYIVPLYIVQVREACEASFGLFVERMGALLPHAVVGDDRCVRHVHLALFPFHHHGAAAVSDSQVVAPTDGVMHVVLSQQPDRFFYIRRIVQHQTDSAYDGQIRLVGVELRRVAVQFDEVCHAQPFLVDAVHGDIRGGKCCHAVHAGYGTPLVAQTDESEGRCGETRVTLIRIRADNHHLLTLVAEIETAAEEVPGLNRAATRLKPHFLDFLGLHIAFGEEVSDVFCHLRVGLGTALLQKLLEAVVAAESIGIEPFVQLF